MTGDGDSVLDVDQIETSALGPDKVVVRVVGRWRGKRRPPDARAFLVVESDGRRHRFPAVPEPRRGGRGLLGRSVQWGASFAIPTDLEPRLGGEMSLWVGDSAIPLPTLAELGKANPGSILAAAPTPAASDSALVGDFGPEPEAVADSEPAVAEPEVAGVADEPEAVAALKAQLTERATAEGQLRGALVDTRAELEARDSHLEQLESAQTELRSELVELIALVADEGSRRAEIESRAVVLAAEVADLQAQLGELTRGRVEREEQLGHLRAELARSTVARAAAESEAAGLRSEIDRLGGELAVARGSADASAGLQEARLLLQEARALTSRLRAQGTPAAADERP